MVNKYVNLILKGLKIEDKKYLFVSMPSFLTNLKKVIQDECKKYDLKEVYFEMNDLFKKHDLMSYLDQENINKHPMFNKSIYDKYAKLDAAFLFIESPVPGLMEDIDEKKITETQLHMRSTQKYFRKLYENGKLYWCIVAYPNKYWAEDLGLTEDELRQSIFDICLVKKDNDPYCEWNKLLEDLDKRTKILNDYSFDYLHYTNDLGTDLKVYLPKNHIWCSGKDQYGVINNIPTLEVFTSPEYDKTEGIVYSAKPLLYNNVMIEDFSIEFKDGKAVKVKAKKGERTLESIINTDEYSAYLGECALVDVNSKVNTSGIIFKETLFDENASCHLALGRGFNECVKNADDLSDDDIRKLGVNDSKVHVDFMIGDDSMKIVGITKDNKEILIMDKGEFVI